MHVIHAFLLVLVPLDWSSRSVGHCLGRTVSRYIMGLPARQGARKQKGVLTGKGGGDGLWSLVAKGAAERRHSDDHGRACVA